MTSIKPVMQFSTRQFNSPTIEGLSMIEKIGFTEKPTMPSIIKKKMTMGDKVLAEYSSEALGNGMKREKLFSNGDSIEFVRDKLGDITSFESNIENYAFSKERLIENIKTAIIDKFSSFFHLENFISKDYSADTVCLNKLGFHK